MKKKKLYWLCQIGGWGLFTFVNIFFYKLGGRLDRFILVSLLLWGAYFVISTHFLRTYIIQKGWLKRYIGDIFPKILLTVLILSLSNYFFEIIVSFGLGVLDVKRDLSVIFVLLDILSLVILYALWVLFYFMYHYAEDYNKSLKAEAAIHQIELNHLKSQLNPHFIFNALNSIRALIQEDPAKSKVAVTQLSNILRNSLAMDKKTVVSLEEEMSTVKDYLALEKIRFEERLQVRVEIEEAAMRVKIPPLMVQTLVENAIKHGISNLKEGGLVSIQARLKPEGYLLLEICNSGEYLPENHQKSTGMGISNTLKRLELLFGEEASFQIKNRSLASTTKEKKCLGKSSMESIQEATIENSSDESVVLVEIKIPVTETLFQSSGQVEKLFEWS